VAESVYSRSRTRPTVYDLHRPVEEHSLRQLPGLLSSSLRLLWSAAPREFVAVATLQIVGGGAAGIQVMLVRKLLSTILSGNQAFLAVVAWLVALGLVTLLTSFSSAVKFELNRLLSELVTRTVAGRVFAVSGAADLETFERPEFHDRLYRAWSTGPMRSMQVSQCLLGLTSSLATLLGVVGGLFVVLPLIIPILFLGVVPILFVTARSSRAFYAFAWGMTPIDRQRSYLGRVLTHREHAHEVIAYGLSAFLTRRWQGLFETRLAQLCKLIRQRLVFAFVASAGTAVVFILPVAVVCWLVMNSGMQLAQAMAVATGILLIRPAMQGLISSGAQLYEVSLYLEDYEEFLRMRDRLTSQRTAATAPAKFESIKVDGLGFRYPEAESNAIDGISLEIRRGEVVAFVGENGSGKTTLAKLICGLYRPMSGRVLWDGVDISAFDSAGLRASIAVLFQDYCQYFLTLRENIGVGRHELARDLDAVEAAAKRSGVHSFVTELPRRYDTLLGPEFEGGHDLSVGQWQRIALARAFIRDAELLILDEPTASLDARSEHEIFESIRSLFCGRTVILISHRFSSVRSADRIHVLSKGRLVESGTHDELMRLRSVYAELFDLQAAGYM
jgi:ATP-binding cassette, subfamily B, bacterial